MTPSNPDPDYRGADGISDDGSNGTTKQKIKDEAHDLKHEVGAKARQQAETGQHRVADEAGALSDAIDAAASSFDDHDREGLARYARELSSNLSDAAKQLEGRSVDELANDAKQLARTNPALFMLGSVAVGFGLSRFFRASAEHDHHKDDSAHRENAQGTGSALQDDNVSTGTAMQARGRDSGEGVMAATTPRSGNGRDLP